MSIPDARLLRPGARVGPYVVEEILGRGGMGAVYRARHAQSGAVHALKLVLAQRFLDTGDRAIARFQREVEALARVDDHPGIVRVFGTGLERGYPWCAMELVEGEPLSRWLERGPLPPKAGARIVEATARAIEHVHVQEIIHRDLKPDNVIVTPDGQPRVLDFGLAFDAFGERLTRTGAMVGSPLYMAPEQLEASAESGRRERIGPWTDVYGLGGILYASLTGKAPFEGRPGIAILAAVVREEPPPPSSITPSVPPELGAIALRALAKAPGDRFASAGELADDLARWQRGEPIRTSVPGVVRRAIRRWMPGSPARRLALAAVAGALLISAMALVASSQRPGDLPPERTITDIEASYDSRRRLSPAEREALGRLVGDPRVAASPALERRVRTAQLLDRLAGSGDGETDEGAVFARELATLLRAEGELDVSAVRRCQRVLHTARKRRAVHIILHGATPTVAAEPLIAADIARWMATDEDAAREVPLDAPAFQALARAPGLDDATRGRLLEARGLRLLATGEGGFDPALAAFQEALQHGVAAQSSRWPDAFRRHVWIRIVELVESDAPTPDLLPPIDLLVRVEDQATPITGALLARLQTKAIEASGGWGLISSATTREIDPERVLLLAAYFATLADSPLYGGLTMDNLCDSLGIDWILERGTTEMTRSPTRRNPAVLLTLAALAARTAALAEDARRGALENGATDPPPPPDPAWRERAGRWTAEALTIAPDRPWAHLVAAIALEHSERDVDALRQLERAFELERVLPDSQRWPVITDHLANRYRYVGKKLPGEFDPRRYVELILETDRVDRAARPRLQEIGIASGIPTTGLMRTREVAWLFRDAAEVMNERGPPACCTTGPLTVDELLDRGLALDEGKRQKVDETRATHREKHAAAAAAAADD